jgi:hypothetical protein
MTPSAVSSVPRELIITLAARYKLPAVYSVRSMVTAGSLAQIDEDL